MGSPHSQSPRRHQSLGYSLRTHTGWRCLLHSGVRCGQEGHNVLERGRDDQCEHVANPHVLLFTAYSAHEGLWLPYTSMELVI